jgi:putative MFS transporter
MATDANVKFKLTDRQKKILPVLMCGSFFEGFDWMVINMALPFIAKDMNIGVEKTGLALSIVAIGTLVAFFIVRMGDKIGRRPIFVWSVCLYAIMSIATAFSPNIYYFIACQFLARVFLVSEWATGLIVISEEFPVETRGRGLALFQGIAGVGAIFPSLLMPVMAMSPIGWRGLFLLGGLPLLIILFLKKNFTETQRFQRTEETEESKPGFFEVFKPEFRKYMLAVSALWFFSYMCYTTAMNFFSYHVVNDFGWTAAKVGLTTSVAYVVGFAGYFVAGKMMDSIGRKITAAVFFIGGSIGTILTFQLKGYEFIFAALIFGTFFIGVFTVICASFTNELFPTRIRATATAWGNNIFGRLAQIITPTLVGFLSVRMGGTGNAASLMAIGPVVATVIVILMLPETRGFEIKDTEEKGQTV